MYLFQESMDDVVEEKEESDDSAIGTAKRSPPEVRVPRQRKGGSQCLQFKIDVSNLDLVDRWEISL